MQQALTGPRLQQALTGLWCNSSDGGRSCWAWDEFLPDGTLRMCGRHDDTDLPFTARARASVTGERLCYTVIEASGDFWLGPGQTYCTAIVDLAADRHRYRDLDGGTLVTLWRRPVGTQRCP